MTTATLDTLDEFTRAYIACALWSTNDESDESGGVPIDNNYGPEHLHPETLARMVTDCAEFQANHESDIVGCEEHAGHDFWLTRNNHGAGFWDGDWEEDAGERLDKACEGYGTCDLYIGDDGLIYC